MDDRSRLAAEVFRSGHRLPTMSIDEYLKNEFDSGNVITGGGYAVPRVFERPGRHALADCTRSFSPP